MALMAGAMLDVPDILESCSRVVRRSRHVHIDDRAVRERAAGIEPGAISTSWCPDALCLPLSREAGANFVLLSDCLNFCFWSDRPWVVAFAGAQWTRTYAMLAGLVRAIELDATWLQPRRWAEARESDVTEVQTPRR